MESHKQESHNSKPQLSKGFLLRLILRKWDCPSVVGNIWNSEDWGPQFRKDMEGLESFQGREGNWEGTEELLRELGKGLENS